MELRLVYLAAETFIYYHILYSGGLCEILLLIDLKFYPYKLGDIYITLLNALISTFYSE